MIGHHYRGRRGNGHEAVVKLLLEKGSVLNSEDRYDRTPMSHAAASRHTEVVNLLRQKGACI